MFKTEHAALLQQHFGSGMNATNLPASWLSTDNAIEDLLFRAKDVVLVIDDFKPTGNAADDSRLHAKADRIFRGTGNAAGRQRMRPDTTLRPPRPPRALPFGTGEEVPRGHSQRARLVVLEYSAGDIQPAALTVCQRDAAKGLYAQVMASFVRWVAPRYDEMHARVRARAVELRDAMSARHRRTPSNIAELMAALEVFVEFVHSTTDEEALTRAESADLLRGWQAALAETAKSQTEALEEADPAARYIELLGSAITSGRAHLADVDGRTPANAEAWGWRLEPVGREHEWRARGELIGWVEDEFIYLDPAAAHKAAREMCGQGEGLVVTEHRLRRLLNERGLLAMRESNRGRLTTRMSLQGARREVLCIPAHVLRPPSQPAQAAQEAPL